MKKKPDKHFTPQWLLSFNFIERKFITNYLMHDCVIKQYIKSLSIIVVLIE